MELKGIIVNIMPEKNRTRQKWSLEKSGCNFAGPMGNMQKR